VPATQTETIFKHLHPASSIFIRHFRPRAHRPMGMSTQGGEYPGYRNGAKIGLSCGASRARRTFARKR
jgi:hypothetical protein